MGKRREGEGKDVKGRRGRGGKGRAGKGRVGSGKGEKERLGRFPVPRSDGFSVGLAGWQRCVGLLMLDMIWAYQASSGTSHFPFQVSLYLPNLRESEPQSAIRGIV